MTRGRSIDKTIAPSRALTQQREYRARKANRILSTLEEENERLRHDNATLLSQVRLLQREVQVLSQGERVERIEVEKVRGDVEQALSRLNDIIGPPISSTSLSSHADVQQPTPETSRSPLSSTTASISAPTSNHLAPTDKPCCPSLRRGEPNNTAVGNCLGRPSAPERSVVPVDPDSLAVTGSITPTTPARLADTHYQPGATPHFDRSTLPPQPMPIRYMLDPHVARETLPIDREHLSAGARPPEQPRQGYPKLIQPGEVVHTPPVEDVSALPSYRAVYPESSEREECCMGLISCEPDIMDQDGV